MTSPTNAPTYRIAPARPEDCAAIARLIHELAAYEKMADECVVTEADLQREIFGPRPSVEVLLAWASEEPVAYAIFFQNFSTFLGRPGLYLEDLYVKPECRRLGIGSVLLKRLAQIAVERNYGRLEWSVLEWNELAKSRYRKLGAAPLEDWRIWRMTGDTLKEFARS